MKNAIDTIEATLAWLVAHPPMAVAVVYLLMSLITYGFYAHDKHAAQQGKWRTPESTLHLLELLCGWPGALLAQRRIRHKNRKLSYQIVFWVVVVLNLSALVYLARLGFSR